MDTDWTFLPNEVASAHSTPGVSHGGNTPSHMPSAMKKLPENVPAPPPYSDDQFLLHQIDESHLHTEFDLDGINFIVPEDLGANSKAFPPLDFPQNTPALMPKSQHVPTSFQSPILPSQNERSYNEEHFIQKHRQRRSQHQLQQGLAALSLALLHLLHYLKLRQQQQHHSQQQPLHQQHVRPDAVFTPLVSPAVTPMDLQVNTNKQLYNAVQTSFEPLTSPALNAQPASSNNDRRRSLSVLGPEEYNGGSQPKRKTPHLTPNLAAHPGSKMKRSPSLRKVPQLFEPLPDSSYDGATTKSSETTPMLPPQSKRVVIDGQGSGSTTPAANVGPGTLMGFTMNRLAELQSNRSSSPSPTLTPNLMKPQRKMLRRDSSSSQRSRRYLKGGDSSLSESSPVLEAQNGEYGGRREKPATKKASHKLAEQGRRNRMNQAVYELSKLIPSDYHEQVSIPSKATTVELAATYIRDLLEEVDNLKYQQRNSRG